ncbi:MAG: HNH endonuclease [Bacteroidota bacterium]|nr:HNH endonuclease [Bacteroidota bacterium]
MKYCSRSCYHKSRKGQIFIDRKCEICGKIFKIKPSAVKKGEGRFCSYKCKGIWWHSQATKAMCETCGKIFQTTPSRRRKGWAKYCSVSCHKQKGKKRVDIVGKANPNWKGGISREPYSFSFDEELKGLIRERDNYKCRQCGAPQEEFTQKLPVHHIDGDKTNSSPENLLTLCVYCHNKKSVMQREEMKKIRKAQ